MNIQLDGKLSNWNARYNDAVSFITNIMLSDKNTDFIKLSKFILTTGQNPYSYLPPGWENSLSSAESTSSLLHTIKHALEDDGELCFTRMKNKWDNPFMLFIDYHDGNFNYKAYGPFKYGDITRFHTNVDRFISDLESSEKAHIERCDFIDGMVGHFSELK